MKQHLINCQKIANLDLFAVIAKLNVSGKSTNEHNITLQSLADSINFMGN